VSTKEWKNKTRRIFDEFAPVDNNAIPGIPCKESPKNIAGPFENAVIFSSTLESLKGVKNFFNHRLLTELLKIYIV